MNKKIITLFLSLLFVVVIVFASHRINLDLENVEDSDATGSVRISISNVRDGSHKVRINARIKDLPNEEGKIFEGWLVDTDADYKLSLGAFITRSNERGSFRFNQNLVNIDIYDKFVITREMIDDTNPGPDVTVFAVDIPKTVINMEATIVGGQEVPPTASGGSGSGSFVLDTSKNTLSFEIEFSDLDGTEVAAHIHGMAPQGTNVGVLFPLPSGSPKIGVWDYDQGQEEDILAGLTYVNIHSDIYPGGEIRGQIEKV